MFRRIRGQYKLHRVIHHLDNQLSVYPLWRKMCPANEDRRHALLDAVQIVIDVLHSF